MYEDGWRSFLRFDLVPLQFPREMMKNRRVVKSLDEYLEVLRRSWDKDDCFVSLYSLPQIKEKVIDTIFLEVDGDLKCPYCNHTLTTKDDVNPFKRICPTHGAVYPIADLKSANERANLLIRFFKKKGWYSRRYFSGFKGYHFYIDIEPVKLKNPGAAIRKVLRDIPPVVDFHVLGDIRRMVRVPFTKHPVTGLFCYPVFSEASFEDAIAPELHIPIRRINDLSTLLLEADEEVSELPTIVGEDKVELFPPCIVEGLAKLKEEGALSHAHRLHLAAFLCRSGFSIDNIVSLFKSASDFRYDLTLYHVTKIAEGGMKCYTCERAYQLNICPLGAKRWMCRWYPSINLTLG